MALEFRLPGDKRQHITMINTPMFGSAHPQTFLDSILALKTGSCPRQAESGKAQGVQGQPSGQPCPS